MRYAAAAMQCLNRVALFIGVNLRINFRTLADLHRGDAFREAEVNAAAFLYSAVIPQ